MKTAVELRAAFAARELSPVELIDAVQEHAELGAFITLTLERAREEAKLAERAYKDGTARPLEGLTLAVKDLFDTEGVRTTYGSRVFTDHVPRADAAAVKLAKDAGAIVVGKTRHARVRLGHHERQPALPAVPQPVGPGADPGRLERRVRGRARHRPGGARARQRHGRLDPHPSLVLRRLGPEADVQPDPDDRRLPARPLARPRRADGAHARGRPPVLRGADRAHAQRTPRTGSRSAPTCTCARSSRASSARSTTPSERSKATSSRSSSRRPSGSIPRSRRSRAPRPRSPTPVCSPSAGTSTAPTSRHASSERGPSRSPTTSRRPRRASGSGPASPACSRRPTCC